MSKPERVQISKKLRFEVFKRDSFSCQYCGRKAPDVILQCDHIKPVVDGGSSDILNLITSCFDCNSGKGARQLSDHAMLSKQLDQLSDLQERREQIEMMLEWRTQLSNLDGDVVRRLSERWTEVCENRSFLTPAGTDKLRRFIKRYGADLVWQAMDESLISYGKREGEEQKLTMLSIDTAFDSIGRVAGVLEASRQKPYLKRLFYIRGILRNRLAYVNEREAISLMEEAVLFDADLDSMENLAKGVSSWTRFKDALLDFIAGQKKGQPTDKGDTQ